MTRDATSPPVARRDTTAHLLHGVERPDPYLWLRHTDNPDVLAHLEAERAYYDAATGHLAPMARSLAEAIGARILDDEQSVTSDRHRFVYYRQRDRGRESGEIRRRPRQIATKSSPDSASGDEIILDIDALQQGSTYVDLGVCEVSPDENLLAYSVDVTGDEVFELRFRDLRTMSDLDDVVPRSYYTGAWSADAGSFFYTVHDESYRPFEVRRHVLGTAADADEVVFREHDEQYEVEVRACRSGRLIVLSSVSRDTSEVWLVDPAQPARPARVVEPRRRGVEYTVEHAPDGTDDRLVIVTNDAAQEYRIMTAPTASPGRDSWAELVAEDPAVRIESVDAFDGFLVVALRSGGHPRLRVLRPDGSTSYTLDPEPAGLIRLAETPRWQTPSMVVEQQSYTQPPAWFDVDLASGGRTLRHRPEVPGYDPDAYVAERITIPARDGVAIPVTVVRRHDVPLDGTAPCLLYGYGAYEAVDEPAFDPGISVLLDHGVVYAHAHVRGGGEGGRRWWLDGSLEHKHHTFDDHIDVARGLGGELVDARRIATRGLSAGGLLQGAVFSQAPEVWRAVVAEVPFVDVVTTMLDPTVPLTPIEWDEWGDPRQQADFEWMLAYSPYDNLPPAGTRPDLLITSALHDPRVMVSEPAKWTAALRHSDPEWAPRCLFRVEMGAGAHTGPSGRFAHVRYEAEVYAWLLERLL